MWSADGNRMRRLDAWRQRRQVSKWGREIMVHFAELIETRGAALRAHGASSEERHGNGHQNERYDRQKAGARTMRSAAKGEGLEHKQAFSVRRTD